MNIPTSTHFDLRSQDWPSSLRRRGFIYFLVAEDNLIEPRLKIGFSVHNPSQRRQACQTGSPVGLKVVAFFKGKMRDERLLHEKFNGLRVRGEWFRFVSPLREYVESLNG